MYQQSVLKRADKAACQVRRGPSADRVLHEHNKLIAPKTVQGVPPPDARLEVLGGRHEEGVSKRMPQGVVNCLKVIQVEEEDADVRSGTSCLTADRLYLLSKKTAIREAGEVVVEGQAGEGILPEPSLRSISHGCRKDHLPIYEESRNSRLRGEFASVPSSATNRAAR